MAPHKVPAIAIRYLQNGNRVQLLSHPFDCCTEIAQTTTTLGVANFAGALMKLSALRYRLHYRALTGGQQFHANRAGCVVEAIADKDILVIGVLLMNLLAQVILCEGLFPIIGEVDDGTIFGRAEAIVAIGLNFMERHGKHSLDRLHAHLLPHLATGRAVLNLRCSGLLDFTVRSRAAICALRHDII